MLTIAAAMFVAWLLLRVITGIRIDYLGGLLIYGAIRVGLRLGGYGKSKAVYLWNRTPKPQRKVLEPLTRITQIEARYRLKLYEVIFSFVGLKPIRIDFSEHHTLISGSSGWGKTVMLNSIMISLFNKGRIFLDNCDVYLIDLKGVERDYLHLWRPVLAGYFSITEGDGGVEEAIATLNRIIDNHLGQRNNGSSKRILIIIDEVAMFTTMSDDRRMRREAVATLNRLSGQIRTYGTVIAATQYPLTDVIPSSIRVNFDRRIAFYLNNVGEGEVALGTRPKPGEMPTQKGEFLLREPGVAGFVRGRAMMPELPAEIDKVVFSLINGMSENDKRLQLYRMAAEGKDICDNVMGINRIYKLIGWTSHEVTLAYRHFSIAGAFDPPEKKGQHHKLKVSYEEGFGLIKRYIEEGNWHKTPKSLRKDVEEQELE